MAKQNLPIKELPRISSKPDGFTAMDPREVSNILEVLHLLHVYLRWYSDPPVTKILLVTGYRHILCSLFLVKVGTFFCSTPAGLEDVSRYPHLLASLLQDPAWSEEDIRKLAGKNLLRVLRQVEEVSWFTY